MANAHRFDPGERGLGTRVVRTEDPLDSGPARALGHTEDAADASHAAVERQLATGRMLGEPLTRDLARRRKEGECDRDVEARAFLLQLSRGEIDRRLVAGPLELGRLDAAADPLLGFLT